MAKTSRWGRGKSTPSGADEAAGTSSGDPEAPSGPPEIPDGYANDPAGYAARQALQEEREKLLAARDTAPATAPDTPPETDVAPATSVEPAATTTTVLDPADLPAPGELPEPRERPAAFSLGDLTPALLARAAHPRLALTISVGVAVAAAFAGRPSREVLLVLVTVLVGQAALGWANDLVDRRRDARHQTDGKPLADGRLDPGTVWFCLALAVLAVVPLSIGNGLYAGEAYLISLAVGLVGQWTWLRRGFFSWVPWAASYALLPAFLSYGGWGGQEHGAPPEVAITVLAGLLGIGVHLLTALWGLVPDNEDRWTYLPLKLGLRLGASRLLWVAGAYTVLVLVAMAYSGTHTGLSQEPL